MNFFSWFRKPKKKSERYILGILIVTNPMEKLEDTIISVFKREKVNGAVIFLSKTNFPDYHRIKKIRKKLRKTLDDVVIFIDKTPIFISQNFSIVDKLDVRQLRKKQKSVKILFTNEPYMAWQISQLFPYYGISYDKGLLTVTAPIPITRDFSGFILKKTVNTPFLARVSLDFNIIYEVHNLR
ncbi:hypothetical protein JYK00_01370 [Thermosipho ferrireducens]|uniref:Uncharacterized protein n=1 Tax=Thermosipho ferrireducens TaxID=2571116 RepID=A0ABX7SAC0_9BACT|nr:hypothetical protein [Thermosipho ferrireducens]QTA38220.1 hypothetical protein JYK00_01370 [Thermosipho ferrireducens]